jgi:polyisoprenoid-binding protein YceI
MKFILFFTSVFFLALTSFTSNSQTSDWTITSSSVTFKIKNAGFTVDGKFGAVTGNISFDPNKTTNLIEASIDAKSINTGNDTRDGHLKKKEYFDVATYTKISMKATSFSKEKDGTIKGYFKLTLKNKTSDIVVPISFTESNGKGQFKATFTINRLNYGIGKSSWILSDDATILIEANVVKK